MSYQVSEYDSSNNWRASYVYGNFIDEPLYVTNNEDGYYYVQNHLYSTVAVVDDSGNVAERYEYDVYGKPYILDADYSDDADGLSDCNNPYMFTGRRVDWLDDGNLTMQINRHRYYSYDMGRWYTHDPLGMMPGQTWAGSFDIISQYIEGLNVYQYVLSSPAMETDIWGLGRWAPPGYIIDPNDFDGLGRREKDSSPPFLQKVLGWIKGHNWETGMGFSRRIPVATIGTFGTVELIISVEGGAQNCCHCNEDGSRASTGAQFKGNAGLAVDAGVGTPVGGIGGGSGDLVKNPVGAPSPGISYGLSGGPCPTCETKFDGKVSLKAYGKAKAWRYATKMDITIGSCSLSGGCQWDFHKSQIEYEVCSDFGFECRAALRGTGEAEGTVILW